MVIIENNKVKMYTIRWSMFEMLEAIMQKLNGNFVQNTWNLFFYNDSKGNVCRKPISYNQVNRAGTAPIRLGVEFDVSKLDLIKDELAICGEPGEYFLDWLEDC